MSTSGRLREYRLGNHVGVVGAMTTTPGNLWFTAWRSIDHEFVVTVGRITKGSPGPVSQFALRPDCGSASMAATGAVVWFTETCRHKTKSGRIRHTAAIGRIAPRGEIERLPLPPGHVAKSVATGRAGDVWFGMTSDDYSGSRFGHLSPGGALREFPAPDGASVEVITVGPEGRLWFPTSFGGEFTRALNSIGPRGDVGKPICAASPCDQSPGGLTTGPDGGIWYSGATVFSLQGGGSSLIQRQTEVENEAGIIGRLVP